MKKALTFAFFTYCLLTAGYINAQTAPSATTAAGVATSDTSQLKQYVGNYAVATGDVKQIIVTIERGHLVGEAVGLGQSGLIASPDTRDAFTVPDPNGGSDAYATVQFSRDAAGKVAKVLLKVQGQNIEGVRTN